MNCNCKIQHNRLNNNRYQRHIKQLTVKMAMYDNTTQYNINLVGLQVILKICHNDYIVKCHRLDVYDMAKYNYPSNC